MRFVIQRVSRASVTIDGRVNGEIQKGFMVLVGVSGSDDEATADKMVRKMINLRIFEDENGKTNLALKDVDGALLLVSQFTLYADYKKGNRPSFYKASNPELGSRLFDYITGKCREQVPVVETGIFGADMKVELVNDGPFTIVLDSDEL